MLTYKLWDKVSPVNGNEAIDIIGQEQMENDDKFILFSDADNKVIAIESMSTIKGTYEITGDDWETVAAAYVVHQTPAVTTLAQLKEQVRADLNAKCRAEIEAGFSFLNHTFLYRESPDQNNMNTAALGIIAGQLGIAEVTTAIDWETEDAGFVTFTAMEFLQIFQYAEKMHKRPKLDKVGALKATLVAATTDADVLAIVW